ncbi:MAG: hypothetical protein Q8Q67_02585 [bacterium]|nr:hypothetical protein [bacterium]
MKKIALFFLLSAILFMSCKKEMEPLPQVESEKLEFINLRMNNPSLFVIEDDTSAQTTRVTFNGATLVSETWQQGIYGGPIIKTCLLWAQSKNEINFLFVGKSDLSYSQLLVVKKDGSLESKSIYIIALLEAELRGENTLWIKYNNSWTRTGPLPDKISEIVFAP